MPRMSDDLEGRLRSVLQERTPQTVPMEGVRRAAVLVPVVGGRDPTLLFTLRTDTVPTHKGQISFPGGSIDDGESPRAAALREAHEELGIESESVRVIGELDHVATFVSGYVVVPVVGWLDEVPVLRLNPREVASVIAVPIGDLTDDTRAEPGFRHGSRTFPTEGWIWHDNVIWGATARILRLFLARHAEAQAAPCPPGGAAGR